MSAATASGTFSNKLRVALDERGMGARTLARFLVREHGGTLEGRRRSVVNWLQGGTATERNRELVEDALGMERGSLASDEEEDSSLVSAIDGLLKQRVHELVERELARQ